jgi:peroxiredoxin Q/BCP
MPQEAQDGQLVPVGKAAPAFSLKDQAGQTHKLADYKGKWVVLYFYPKDDTSGCTKQACQFRDAATPYQRADAVVLGVSPDSEASHAKFASKYKLPFTLLADPDKKVLAKYGVWQEKSMYGRKYMGVVRTTYLIDPSGKVAQRWDKVKVPDHDKDVLAAIASGGKA